MSAGLNGLSLGFRYGGANPGKRIACASVVVFDPTDTKQNREFILLPTAANQKAAGVTVDYFVEPMFFPNPTVDPTTITGTAPTQTLAGRSLTLQLNGVAPIYAAGAINQGDLLVIADVYGRVTTLAGASIGAGATANLVGVAMNSVLGANEIVRVRLDFSPRVAA
jgi:hypothetical protein